MSKHVHAVEVWGKGIAAAAIAGAANGVITGLAAVGIDPSHFNLQSGLKATMAVAGASATMSAGIGVAAYLKQSPLPSDDMPPDRGDHDDRAEHDEHDEHAEPDEHAERGEHGEHFARRD